MAAFDVAGKREVGWANRDRRLSRKAGQSNHSAKTSESEWQEQHLVSDSKMQWLGYRLKLLSYAFVGLRVRGLFCCCISCLRVIMSS